jgi:hypothetical protein
MSQIEITPALLSDLRQKAGAASPAVVLALVAEIERLRNRLDDLECPNCGNQPKFCMCDVVPLSGSEIHFVTKGVNNADQA